MYVELWRVSFKAALAVHVVMGALAALVWALVTLAGDD